MIAAVDPDSARADARDILGDRRFSSDPAPRPLRGVLEWIGDRLRPVGDLLADIFAILPWYVWLAFAIAIAVAAVVTLVPRAKHHWAASGPAASRGERRAAEDPDELELAAVDAERNGEFDRAVRLRFRAGLLRLGARGAIEYTPAVTVGEVRRTLESPPFEQLASTFEEIAYGERDAAPPDVDASRNGWPRVLDESRSR